MSMYPDINSEVPDGLIDIKLMTKRRSCDDNWRLSGVMAVCFFAGLLLAVLWFPGSH